jgi:hypothetical protein
MKWLTPRSPHSADPPVRSTEPFIGKNLRPDLRFSALAREKDLGDPREDEWVTGEMYVEIGDFRR